MINRISGYTIERALHDEGLLPPECLNVELLFPIDAAFTIRYEVYVKPEDMVKVARAIAKVGEEMVTSCPIK